MPNNNQRVAVILFNLGGPDSLDAVRPFLINLFTDPAIIAVPTPVRRILAYLIAWRRSSYARDIYRSIGGASPLLQNTRAQANLLEAELGDPKNIRCFVAMRYWHPMSEAVATEVKKFSPEKVVLLPLYPQFSHTTSGSSIKAWHVAAAKAGLNVPTNIICCYPNDPLYIAAVTQGLREELSKLSDPASTRVLFSAHGLPKKNIASGDPYQWQIEQTVTNVVKELGISRLDWKICYQSRVGPLEWIGPYIEDELNRAAHDNLAVLVVPIAFVSEHSETLFELDIEYRSVARQLGIPEYRRVSTLGTDRLFIVSLANMVRRAAEECSGLAVGTGAKVCSDNLRCFMESVNEGKP